MDEGRKADDGRLVLLVRLPVDNHESALREYWDRPGKRSAVKVACCVWNGGKAVKPDLSLPKSSSPPLIRAMTLARL